MKHNFKHHLINALLVGLFYMVTFGVLYLAYNTEYVEDESFTPMRLLVFILLLPILFKYLIQLLTLCFYNFSERSRERRHTLRSNAKVSVLIPAWNEEVGIIKTINSVLVSEYQDVEIVVINDGSTDKTDKLVSSFVANFNSNKNKANKNNAKSIQYLSINNGGKARALNKALAIATGEIIITIDADCLMDRMAITNTLKRFGNAKVGAVCGNVVVGNRKKSVELMQQLEYLYGFFFKRADSVFNSVYIIGGAAAAYRKTVLDEVGCFDEKIVTEDIEMSMRILSYGYKTRYAADAVTYTEGPSKWRCLFNQRLRWRFGRFQTFIKYKQLFFSAKQHHNRYFTFLLLPVALYAEFALLFQGLFLAAFYSYTFITSDFIPLVFVIVFMALMVCLQIIFDSKSKFHLNLLFLAPIAWLVFYVVDVVEFQALFRSLKRLVKQEELKWQKWARVGLLSQSVQEKEEKVCSTEQ